ncbi:MAG TPA: DUF4199 domain-containing protein [Pyrinomonadaceae bacterium]|jgi:hypothetical protein|nr:DUF4199 domain-containing protein [Pyrinomonadaceae bacterium]
MKKIVITFGVISGLILAGFVFLISTLCGNETISMDHGELIGYTTMAISLSMIFFGIKSYRDNVGKGKITFWKGIQIGLLITLIASVFYFAGAEAYNVANPGFVDKIMTKFTKLQTEKMQQAGASQEEIDKTVKFAGDMAKAMENPFIFYAICLMELAPVGLIITLISAAILRRKDVLPLEPAAA